MSAAPPEELDLWCRELAVTWSRRFGGPPSRVTMYFAYWPLPGASRAASNGFTIYADGPDCSRLAVVSRERAFRQQESYEALRATFAPLAIGLAARAGAIAALPLPSISPAQQPPRLNGLQLTPTGYNRDATLNATFEQPPAGRHWEYPVEFSLRFRESWRHSEWRGGHQLYRLLGESQADFERRQADARARQDELRARWRPDSLAGVEAVLAAPLAEFRTFALGVLPVAAPLRIIRP